MQVTVVCRNLLTGSTGSLPSSRQRAVSPIMISPTSHYLIFFLWSVIHFRIVLISTLFSGLPVSPSPLHTLPQEPSPSRGRRQTSIRTRPIIQPISGRRFDREEICGQDNWINLVCALHTPHKFVLPLELSWRREYWTLFMTNINMLSLWFNALLFRSNREGCSTVLYALFKRGATLIIWNYSSLFRATWIQWQF